MKRQLIKILIFFLSFSAEIRIAHAEELSIIDVRRNIPLSDHEPTYRDYYIAGDGIQNLKKNLVLEVVRKNNIRDASGAQSYGEILIPVGQLRVIANYGRVAIAREYKYFSREDYPTLDQTFMMTGDRVSVKNSFIDTNKIKKTADNEMPDTNTLVTAISAFGIPLSPAVVAALSQLQTQARASEMKSAEVNKDFSQTSEENSQNQEARQPAEAAILPPKNPETSTSQVNETGSEPKNEPANHDMAKAENTETQTH